VAAIAFDTLKAARRLIKAGVSPKQAEAQAEIMAEAFVFNADSLVTKDYLDARFAEQEARIDRRFAGVDARFDLLAAEFNGKFRLVYWMLSVVILTSAVPVIRSFIGI